MVRGWAGIALGWALTGCSGDPEAGARSSNERASAVFERFGIPEARTAASTGAAAVRLPSLASGPVLVRDEESGAALRFTLRGASAVPRAASGAAFIFEEAGPGAADWLQRVTATGVEDFLFFQRRPPREAVEYVIHLESDSPQGVRVVGGVVELVDSAGAPRFRMGWPFVVGGDGRVAFTEVAVDGCAVDDDPAPPWGRPVADPGASRCVVRVSWDGMGVAYPALLDPSWTTTTTTMSAARRLHTATKLPSGRVLVAGGELGSGNITMLSTADLFDPATDTWAATDPMDTPRTAHAADLLQTGKVLVAGGQTDSSTVLSTAELYDESTGTWAPTGSMTFIRRGLTLTTLANGEALATAGFNGSAYTGVAERFRPGSDNWAVTGGLSAPYGAHTATLLGTGEVFLGGGLKFGSVATNESNLFDPVIEGWFLLSGAADSRHDHAAALLDDGTVLLAGSADTSGPKSTAEVFDPGPRSHTAVGSMASGRALFALTPLPGGALATGGQGLGTQLSTAEIYDVSSQAWTAIDDMAQARRSHTATRLDDGRVLVAGGEALGAALSSSELLTLGAQGDACSVPAECASGFCSDGVCCDTACTGTCMACTAAKTGGTDGSCAAVGAGTDPDDDCTDDGSPGCGQNGLCDGAGACESYAASSGCVPLPCTTDGECTSGHCAGVCCDAACTGTCEACTAAVKGQGEDGLCGPIAAGTDPLDECAMVGSGACQADAVCDGAGACEATSAGTVCGAGSCVDAVTLEEERACTAQGECPATTTSDCSPYACSAGACLTSCTGDGDCAPGISCMGGACQPLGNGGMCTTNAQCQSAFCVDGVCCDSACTGQCEACDFSGSEGTCSAVTGTPRGSREACRGTLGSSCRGSCDGVTRDACAYPGSSVICATSCDGDSAERFVCDGTGACQSLPTVSDCAPYSCDPGTGACFTACASSADCSSGVSCVGMQCGGTGGSGGAGGTGATGAGGSAGTGAAAGSSGSGKKSDSGDDGGCGCRAPSASPPSGAATMTLLALTLLARRRRRR